MWAKPTPQLTSGQSPCDFVKLRLTIRGSHGHTNVTFYRWRYFGYVPSADKLQFRHLAARRVNVLPIM
jgi:hypothetical protein